jgi:acyl transferase domain-containing protein
MGHAAAAAGVGSVIKAVMALRHRVMPRTLHVDEPSPMIDWASGKVELLTQAREWTQQAHPRRAGISAFGASGTNAHVIVEEAPAPEPPPDAPERAEPYVLGAEAPAAWPLSARGADALRAQARRLLSALRDRPEAGPADVGLSLATTRAAFEHRAVVVGGDRDDLLAGLESVAHGRDDHRVVAGRAPAENGRTVFVFPGQGAQWAGMAGRLMETSPVFAAHLRDCADAFAPLVDWSLLDVLRNESDTSWLGRVDMVQPALFAVMVGLAGMWRSCGVEPAAVVGHSQGEIAAAHVAGGLSLEDAARVVTLRSSRIREIAGRGGMLSAALPRDEAAALLRDRPGLSLAAVNGTRAVVVSGDDEELARFAAELQGRRVRAKRVPVDYASHSAHVDGLREHILADLATIRPRTGDIPLYSTLTGAPVDTATMDASYWYANLRNTVELEQAVRALADAGHTSFIEVSPHGVLLPALEDTLEDLGVAGALTGGTLRRDDGDLRRFLLSLGRLHTHGVAVDWNRVFAGTGGAVTELPTYAFQRQRYWLRPDAAGQPRTAASADDGDFWNAVAEQDFASLGIDVTKPFQAALPVLSAWRRESEERAVIDTWLYHVDWAPLPEPAAPSLPGRWLLLCHAGQEAAGLPAQVTSALAQHGAQVIPIVLPPAELSREQLAKRLTEAAGDGAAGVLSLLGLDGEEHQDHPGVPAGLAATLACVQALGDVEIGAPLWAVTSGAVSVGGPDAVEQPAQTAVWGLGRVAALEYPGRWGGLVDLPPALDEVTGARLAGTLAGRDGEDQVAVRSSGVYGRRLARSAPGAARRWRPRGTALLVGGTGGVGAQIARWLAEQGAPRLVLTGRRGPDAPGAAELARELRDLGAEVAVVACDAGDRTALARIKQQAAADGHPVTTVMHIAGAGVLRDLHSTDLAEFAGTTYAKIAGAEALDAVFSDPDELDDFLLFSSISAIWGSGEHGAYAAANAYLDGLAENRRARGLPARSVVWGIWDPKEGGGMAAGLVEDQLRSRGIPFMDPAVAIKAFHRVLGGDRAVQVVADVDWERFAPVFTLARPSPLLRTLPEVRAVLRDDEATGAPDGGDSSLRQRLEAARPAERAQALDELVRSRIAAVLKYSGPDRVDPGRALRELGFDSLTAVELRNRLRDATGLRLPVTVVFDHPNATALAEHIGRLMFPEDDRPAGADPAETEVRQALATIPLDRLREAGLLGDLLRLASGAADERDPAPGGQDAASVDDMDVDSLVQLVLKSSGS